MRYAIIDCGTNTFNLLIVSIEGNIIKKLYKTKRVVKLGSAGLVNRIIGEKPQERAVHTLHVFRQLAESYFVNRIIAVGTSALRDARNSGELLKRIQIECKIKIDLISGAEEAKLIYEGVRQASVLVSTPSLIMDIGGGSTEFIICTDRKILWKKSYRLGAARLIELFEPSDPVTKDEIKIIDQYLAEQLDSLDQAVRKFAPLKLVGSSGSFDTFAALIVHRNNHPGVLRNKNNYVFRIKEYNSLHKHLTRSTYKERLVMPGMLRMRADMIVIASILLNFILQRYAIKHFELSTFALKEGLLQKLIKTPVKSNG